MKVLFACLCLCLMISLSVQWHPRRRHTRPPRHTTTPEPTTTTTEPTTTTTEPTTTEPTTTTTEPTTTEPTTTTTTETTTKQSLIDLILEGLKKKFEETLYKILKFKKEKFVAILKGLVKLGKAAAKELLDLLHKWLLKHHDLPEDEDTRVQQMMYTLETYIEQGEDEDEHGIIDLILAGLKNKFEETIQKVIQLKKKTFESVVKNVARLGKAAAKKVIGYFVNFLNKHHDLPGDGALRVSQMMDSLQTYVDEDENEKTLSRGKRFVGRIIDGLIKEKVEFVQEALKLKKEKFVEVVHGLGKLAKGAAKKVFGFFRRFIGGHHDLPGDGALRISEMMGAAETAAENNPDEVPTSGAVFPLMSVATTLVTLLIALFV